MGQIWSFGSFAPLLAMFPPVRPFYPISGRRPEMSLYQTIGITTPGALGTRQNEVAQTTKLVGAPTSSPVLDTILVDIISGAEEVPQGNGKLQNKKIAELWGELSGAICLKTLVVSG